jgi:hypothetical protein
MAKRQYQIDRVILSADRGKWPEELNHAFNRCGQEDWALVALLNDDPQTPDAHRQASIAGAASLTLIFQRRV